MKKWGVLGALGCLAAWEFQGPSASLGTLRFPGPLSLGGGSLGTLGIPGTLWLLGFPSVPWGSSGPPRLAVLRVRALGELHENCCERVPFG